MKHQDLTLAKIKMTKYLLCIIILFLCCNDKATKTESIENKLSYLDSVKGQCQFATILLQTNYPNGKVLVEAKQFKGMTQIDSLFSFIGDPVFDTTTSILNTDRTGKISLFKDTSEKVHLLDLDFYFSKKFEGYKVFSTNHIHTYKFTSIGKVTLLNIYEKFKPKLKL